MTRAGIVLVVLIASVTAVLTARTIIAGVSVRPKGMRQPRHPRTLCVPKGHQSNDSTIALAREMTLRSFREFC